MAIDDNTVYGLTGAQVKELPEKIEAVKGQAKELTAADYNYHSSGSEDNSVGLWKLEPGLYYSLDGVRVNPFDGTGTTEGGLYLVSPIDSTYTNIVYFTKNPTNSKIYKIRTQDGVYTSATNLYTTITDSLTSQLSTSALSSKQGRILKELIDSLVVSSTTAPTTLTEGTVGQLLEDTTNGKLYICTVADTTTPEYTWTEIATGTIPDVSTKLDNTTTFWGQTANNGVVSGDVLVSSALAREVPVSVHATNGTKDGGISLTNYTIGESVVRTKLFAKDSNNGTELTLSSDATTDGATLNAKLNMQNHLITNVADPVNNADATSKSYVDGLVGDIVGVKVLTIADYNYPAFGPNAVALWLLEPGVYQTGASSTVQVRPNSSILIGSSGETYIIGKSASTASVLRITQDGATVYSVDLSSGANNRTSNLYTPVLDSLTSTSTTSALAAGQGKVLNDKVVAATSYTTSEVDTGGTWVDGSTIYKKTISCGALPNSTTKNVNTGISNLSRIVKYDAYAYRSSTPTTIPLPFIDTTNLSRGVNITFGATTISITTSTDRSDFDESYVTLYYTKSS